MKHPLHILNVLSLRVNISIAEPGIILPSSRGVECRRVQRFLLPGYLRPREFPSTFLLLLALWQQQQSNLSVTKQLHQDGRKKNVKLFWGNPVCQSRLITGNNPENTQKTFWFCCFKAARHLTASVSVTCSSERRAGPKQNHQQTTSQCVTLIIRLALPRPLQMIKPGSIRWSDTLAQWSVVPLAYLRSL